MRILIFHNSSDLYGASKILLFTVDILNQNEHNCLVILPSKGLLTEEFDKVGISYKIINLAALRRKYFNIPGIYNRIKTFNKSWKQLKLLIKEERPDLIYTNTSGIIISAFLAKKYQIKHVWHLHEIIQKPKLFSILIGKMINRYSDKVVVVSNAVKAHWETYVDSSKIKRIYNGIKTDLFLETTSNLRNELKIDESEIVISMIGRINHWKGQDYFLEIAELLNAKFQKLKFLMVGDPFPGNEHLLAKLETKIASLHVKDNLINLHYRSDINRILNATDIFVCPSILPDPFPTVILEAMATGKPVVATSLGGALEMISENETGLFIPVNNPEKAVEIISTLIHNPQLISAYGMEGQKRLNNYFSYNAYQKNVLQLIDSLT